MANRLYNKQVSPKGYEKGGGVKKMVKTVTSPMTHLRNIMATKKKKAKMKKDK